MIKRGLYIGRFNPPHLGHFKAIKSIINEKKIDQLIIGIGSAQESYTLNNPFTGGERFEMIIAALKELHISNSNIIIVPLVDLNNNNQWITYLKSILPKFEIIYSNNPLVRLLTKSESNLQIQSITLINRKEYTSTNIRRKIVKGDQTWKNLVPKSIEKNITQINGIERIKLLVSNDLVE